MNSTEAQPTFAASAGSVWVCQSCGTPACADTCGVCVDQPRLYPTAPVCCDCGRPRTFNRHPDAGKPGMYLEVNTKWVCIPCLTLNRHRWAQRAMRYECALNRIVGHQARTSLGEAMDLRRIAEDALRESP